MHGDLAMLISGRLTDDEDTAYELGALVRNAHTQQLFGRQDGGGGHAVNVVAGSSYREKIQSGIT